MAHDVYENPLISRYASAAMSRIWSAQKKHSTWRRLWVALAEAEQELGLEISDAQIEQLKGHVDEIDFERAAFHEKRRRHDVMAHVETYGEQCPEAKGIIHLGATSCYVTDNTELIQLREALELTRLRLVNVIDEIGHFAANHADQPCLGFTHLQPAQPTTMGKRAALWCQDLLLDLEEVEHRLEKLRFRGVKGTTGTQASFLQLFNGDHAKVEALDRLVSEKMGFSHTYPVTGQTYSRKVDAQALDTLSGIAQSAHKAATDIRILQHRKELEEPFEKEQIGSSAMAYKRNPMRTERICALARFAMSLVSNGAQTMATQWMERSLDDSANRRLSLPQAFLAVDAVLVIYRNVADGMVVYPKVLEKNLRDQLPFMATESFMMAGVEQGGDRQELHERVRVHSHEAARQLYEEGKPNGLLEMLRSDPAFANVDVSVSENLLDYVGRAPEQVHAFVHDYVRPVRVKYAEALKLAKEELRV